MSPHGSVGDACDKKQAHNWQKEPPAHFAYVIRKKVVSYCVNYIPRRALRATISC
jgi:hypothetical protein